MFRNVKTEGLLNALCILVHLTVELTHQFQEGHTCAHVAILGYSKG